MQTVEGSINCEGNTCWNKNPSFTTQHFPSDEPCLRTVDGHLVQVARQALDLGLLSTSDDAIRVSPKVRATGMDGLSWSRNPTYSDEEESISDSLPLNSSGSDDDSLDINVLPIKKESSNSCQSKTDKEGQIDKVASIGEFSKVADNDTGYEWMEIIKMQDVGVQTEPEESTETPTHHKKKMQHRLELKDQEIVMFFDEITNEVESRSHPSQDYYHHVEIKEFGEPLPQAIDSKGRDMNRSLSSRENNEQEDMAQNQYGCSLGQQSECLNNLPSFQPSLQYCSVNDQDPILQQDLLRCNACVKKDDRLEIMENEIRELKTRMADLEIELCNKDSLIAQQDSMIHRLTYTTRRSHQLHRRNFSSYEIRSQFDVSENKTLFSNLQEESNVDARGLLQKQQVQIKSLLEVLEKCRPSP
jgi:hypothetical protein